MKLEVPRFDGKDPLGWIFKITQFFDYQGVSDAERLTVASFYMEGPALCWFQWMSRNGFLTSWQAMLQALETRFAPSYYDDPYGALFKIQQRGTVNEYLSEFERLANRVVGLAPPLSLSCFISGLNPELHREVQALQPMCLPQAMALAKLQEDKLLDRRRNHRHNFPVSPTPHHPNNPPPSSSTSATNKPPIRRLTPEEMALKRDKGLCYHCDEKWSLGHRCNPRIHLFIAAEDPDTPFTSEPPDSPPS